VSAALLLAVLGPSLRVGVDLGDEGYLWYGTQRTLAGEVAIRDFRAYDPGRYWWCAAVLRVLGPGLIQLRIACGTFQWLGLTAGVVAATRATGSVAAGVAAGAVLAVWGQPRHKPFEASATCFAVLAGQLLLEHPSGGRAAVVGLVVGLGAVLGLNLALYLGVAAVSLLAVLARAGSVVPLAELAVGAGLGLLVGAAPVLAAALLARGYARAYWRRKVAVVLGRRTTNLPLPVPGPRRARRAPQLAGLPRGGPLLAGALFSLAPLAPAVVLLTALVAPGRGPGGVPLAVAAAAVALPAAHGARSRAEVGHLTMWAHPLLLLAVAATTAGTVAAAAAWTGLAAATALVALPAHPLARRWHERHRLVEARAGGARLLVTPGEDHVLAVLQRLARGRVVVALPVLVGVHAMVGGRAPAYDTFCVYPATPEEDAALRDELLAAGIEVAIVDDAALDGRDDLRFRATHPRTWEMLESVLSPAPALGLPASLLVRTTPAPG
jgi:hypothetical protein